MDGNKHEERFAVQGPELRAHPRYSVDEDCQLLFVNHGVFYKARVVDLSEEGCRLRISGRVTARAGWPVEVTFKVKGRELRFSGAVRWNDGSTHIGIHFESTMRRRKEELAEVIAEMAAAAAARAEALNRLVADQEAREAARRLADETSARLLAGADTTIPGDLVAGTSCPGQEAPAVDEPLLVELATPGERRGEVRLSEHHFATVYQVKAGFARRGRILTLGPSSCRIRMDRRIPMRIYTHVETELRLRGLRFRLGSVIEAIHNRYTAEIRFLDVSDRDRERILELIGEIEHAQRAIEHAKSSAAHTQTDPDGA
jgi:hypothetical protein